MSPFWALFVIALQILHCRGLLYKVGDLDSWGLPPPTKSNLYAAWSQNHHFKIGDSLLFLYPPSQDSVIQVTARAYNNCITSDPIAKMGDGNSLFNITAPGNFYFISGQKGHCEKKQKIEIQVASADGKFLPPAGSDPPSAAPSYTTAFGPIPMGSGSGSGSGSASARSLGMGGFMGGVGSAIGAVILWVFM